MKFEGSNRCVRIVDCSVQRTVQVRAMLRVLACGEPPPQEKISSAPAPGAANPKRRRIAVSTRAIERSAVCNAADDDHIAWQRERLRIVRGIHQIDCLVAVFEQEVQLPKNLGKAPALDLVDNQHEQLIRMLTSSVGQTAHRTRFQFKADLPIAVRAGPEAFEEILVAVRRVELHDGDIVQAGEMPSQRLRDVHLPGTGRLSFQPLGQQRAGSGSGRARDQGTGRTGSNDDANQTLDRLTDRFALLSGAHREVPSRQQTLRLSVDWSYKLCATKEQQLWIQLGRFELKAVEGECDRVGAWAQLLDQFAPISTGREKQVAELVATGLTNKDIAATLLNPQRTTQGHVECIPTRARFHLPHSSRRVGSDAVQGCRRRRRKYKRTVGDSETTTRFIRR